MNVRGFRRPICIVPLALWFSACSHPQTDKNGDDDAAVKQPPVLGGDAATARTDAGLNEGSYLGALFMQTPIMSDTEWPMTLASRKRDLVRDPAREHVQRIGYLRRGGKVQVLPHPHRKPNCPDGWYELIDGGFVCGKYATLDLNHPRFRTAPHTPFMDEPLPYLYATNATNGTPLYRSIPSRDERTKLEPWLTGKKPKPVVLDESPYDLDAGVMRQLPDPTTTAEADALDGGVPWYLREYDGGKPEVTLDDLKGEGGPVIRRMVKGFIIAIDKEMKEKNIKWWKTTEGYLAPYDRVFPVKLLTNFHGVWFKPLPEGTPNVIGNPPMLDGGTENTTVTLPQKLPVAFILWRGHKYNFTPDKKRVTRQDTISRFTAVGLTGESTLVGGMRYWLTEEGWWMKEAEGQITHPGPPPKDLLPGEKWIDVNLTTQTLVAFEGDQPVFTTLISSGKKDPDNEEKNHETKPGVFRIREKHIAAVMDGDVASDGPYSIEDVPWIMYFNGSIALHGAFWHANFGRQQSHGCVNLAPMDARALFGWTEPSLPNGWHGVMATPEKQGTRVVVHE